MSRLEKGQKMMSSSEGIVRCVIMVLGILTVGGTQAAAQSDNRPATTMSASPETEQRLAPGDIVRLAFWRDPDLNGDYQIDEQGLVVLPLLGELNATELPPSQLKRELTAEYAERVRNQQVQITLLRRVRILGAVTEPGLYHVDPTMNLGDAIAVAGGATPNGKLHDIQIARRGERLERTVDLYATRIGELQSGDQITIPERSWISRNSVFVIGSLVSATTLIVINAAFR